MKRKFGILVLLAAASFSLTAEDCVLENKNIDVPLRGDVDMPFTSQGFSDADAETVDFGAELADILSDEDSITSLVSGGIEGGWWRLVKNWGEENTTIQGSVDVIRMRDDSTAVLIARTKVDLSTVGTTFVPAPLETVGVNLLTDGFGEFIVWWNAGADPNNRPDLRYMFLWQSVSSTDADFDWDGRLRFILTGVFNVDVPDIWR
jgi:hypothetical protein